MVFLRPMRHPAPRHTQRHTHTPLTGLCLPQVNGATVSSDLQAELARAVQAHDDLLAAYESKLRHHGIPTDDLGFKPLRSERSARTTPKATTPGQPPGSR